jgi:hypothetical protein
MLMCGRFVRRGDNPDYASERRQDQPVLNLHHQPRFGRFAPVVARGYGYQRGSYPKSGLVGRLLGLFGL